MSMPFQPLPCDDAGATPCASPVATTGLCLADGTPIAVVARATDCDTDPEVVGWLDLTTGAFTVGPAPAGAVACTAARAQFEVGQWCDLDAAGEVIAPVLVEYEYDEDGQLVSVRTLTPAGDPYTVTGTLGICPGPVGDAEFQVLCDTAADGTVTQFLRAYSPNGDGTASFSDTDLNGATYTPTGTVGACASPCLNCETLLLCDDGADDPATLTGTVTSGTLTNGVTWQARGTAPTFPAGASNADGAWWGLGIFPNTVVPPTTWTFSRPVHVEFSVVMRHWAGGTPGADNTVQLPAGVEPVSLPPGYHHDPVTGLLTVDATVTDCPSLTAPSKATSARFKITNAVTTFTLRYLGSRIANCGVFGNWKFGAITVTPAGQFLRTICRDCDGTTASVTDTTLDGTTPYTPLGAVGQCGTAGAEPAVDAEPLLLCDTAGDGTSTEFLRHYLYDASGTPAGYQDTALDGTTAYVPSGTVGACSGPPDCQTQQVCVRPSGQVEFISNLANLADASTDLDWTWSTAIGGPTWWPMYRVGVHPGWTVTDPGTAEGTAHWVAPHPDRGNINTGAVGEGPNTTPDWYAKASFELPASADPSSIRISATVLNADQLAVEWRLNGGAWQPVNRAHNSAPYTLAPTAVPGAQAGTNELLLHVRETVLPQPAAGLIVHLIAEYEVDDTAYLQWSRVSCNDGTLYYLDDVGVRQDSLPDGWTTVPCPAGEAIPDNDLAILCDTAAGTVTQFVRDYVRDATGTVTGHADYTLDGSATYTPAGTVGTCGGSGAAPVLTGARALADAQTADLAAEFPTLQSVTLIVTGGVALATMSDGNSVPFPAGTSATWSIENSEDAALAAAEFTGGGTGSAFLLVWTYKA